jgi:hypothetical protein
MTVVTRMEKLGEELTPKQRVLAGVLEWRDSKTPGEYARRRYADVNAYANQLEQLKEGVKRQFRGFPRDEVDKKARAAAQEFVFLDELVNHVNARLCEHYSKFSYIAFMLSYMMEDDEHLSAMCRMTVDETIGEFEIVRRIQTGYFDGQQIAFAGAIKCLEYAEKTWWTMLRIAGDIDTNTELVQATIKPYVDGFVRSHVTLATLETHEFFGRDAEVKKLRETMATWGREALPVAN